MLDASYSAPPWPVALNRHLSVGHRHEQIQEANALANAMESRLSSFLSAHVYASGGAVLTRAERACAPHEAASPLPPSHRLESPPADHAALLPCQFVAPRLRFPSLRAPVHRSVTALPPAEQGRAEQHSSALAEAIPELQREI